MSMSGHTAPRLCAGARTHPHVPAGGVGVQVVGVDVEWHQADGREGGRVDDGHVVGGVDADGGHVGAGARAHVRDSVLGEWMKTSTMTHLRIRAYSDIIMEE